MKLSRKKLAEIFLDYIEKASTLDEATIKIAAYLVEARRASELKAIIREMTALHSAHSGVVEIDATSANQLQPATKQVVVQLFEAKQAVFNETIDKTILGGARFESLDKKVDLTMKHKLDNLKAAPREI